MQCIGRGGTTFVTGTVLPSTERSGIASYSSVNLQPIWAVALTVIARTRVHKLIRGQCPPLRDNGYDIKAQRDHCGRASTSLFASICLSDFKGTSLGNAVEKHGPVHEYNSITACTCAHFLIEYLGPCQYRLDLFHHNRDLIPTQPTTGSISLRQCCGGK